MDIEYNFTVFTITQLKILCQYVNICSLGTKDMLINKLNEVNDDNMDYYIDMILLNNHLSCLSI